MKKKFTKLANMFPELRHEPIIRAMIHREERAEELSKMMPMSMHPSKSGYIFLLHNRVNLHSSGNINLKTKVWYDRQSQMIGISKDECIVPWTEAKLKNGCPAKGWMYDESCSY